MTTTARFELTQRGESDSTTIAFQNSEHVVYIVPLAGNIRASVDAPTGEMEWLGAAGDIGLGGRDRSEFFYLNRL